MNEKRAPPGSHCTSAGSTPSSGGSAQIRSTVNAF